MNASLAAITDLTRALGPFPASATALVVGLLLVLLGRRLFWLFVAGMGFLAGLQFAPALAPNQPSWIILLIGLGCGLLGALLSVILQRVAVALAGGYAGGLLAARFAIDFLGFASSTHTPVFIVGAIIAAVLVSLLYDWALIALTSIIGALLVIDGLNLPPQMEWFIAILLAIAGALVQSRALLAPSAPPGRSS